MSKICTSIKQSQKLIELGINVNTADMDYTLEVKDVNSEFLKKHFEETPQEELDKEWKEIEPLNDIGPDVLKYADKIKNE